MNTSGYEAGARKVQTIEKNIRRTEKMNRLESANEAKKVNQMRQAFEEAYDKYAKARAKRTKDSTKAEKEAVEKLRKEMEKLDAQYQKGLDALKLRIAKNREHVQSMKDELAMAKKVNTESASLSGKLTKVGKGLIAGIAGKLTIGAFTSIIDEMDAIGKRAKDLGVTASQLQAFQHEANKAGIDASALDSSLRQFGRSIGLASMGTKEYTQVLSKMGISLTDANGLEKEQGDILQEVAQYFQNNANSAETAGIAARLFGERGTEILRIFKENPNAVSDVFNANAIDDSVKSAEKFKNTMAELSQNLLPHVYRIVGRIATGINTFVNDWKHGFGSSEHIEALKKQNQEAAKLRSKILAQEKKEEEKREKEIAGRRAEFEDNLKREAENKVALEVREFEALIAETKEIEKQEKAEKRKADAEAKRAQKKAEREAKKAQEDAKRMAERRQEFELQQNILKLENGTEQQKAQADAIKNAIERNRLMKEYGYTIEQANQKLIEMKRFEQGDKVEYSDKDKKRAQKVLDRAKAGKTVGKKTLEQAQAIVDGKAIEGGAVAMFQNAQATAKKPKVNIAPDWAMQRLGVQTPQVGGVGVGAQAQVAGNPMATGAMGAVAPQPTNPLQFGITNPMQFSTGNPLQFSKTNPMQFGAQGAQGQATNPLQFSSTNPLQFNPQQNQLNVQNANQNAESKDANKDENKEEDKDSKVVEKLEEILEKMEKMTDEIKDIFKE